MNNTFTFEFDGESLPETVQKKLTRLASFCLATEGVHKPCYAFLQITDDEEIHRINLEYRSVDKATDVLSFPAAPFSPSQTAGCREDLLLRQWDPENRACYLGDIIISKEHCAAQANEFGHSFERELAYLTAHALFHLMGYDHMNEEDKAKMRVQEEAALSKAGISRVSDDELCRKAKEAMAFSYSPYSHFKVGACLLTADGKMYTGCNIENASYGVTNCAQRTALFNAVSRGERSFTDIAIAAEKAMPWPCGVCRQALNEFAPHLRVIVTCGDETDEAYLDELLPHSFGPSTGTDDFLGKE